MAIGHSHLRSLENAYAHAPRVASAADVEFIQLWRRYEPFFVDDNYNPELIGDVSKVVASDRLDGVIAPLLGGESFAIAFSGMGEAFDFHLPDWPPEPSDATLVPYGLLRAKFLELSPYVALVHELARLSSCPVYYPLPPPPVGDDDFTMRHLPPELADIYADHPLPTRSLRLKVWRGLADAITEICEAGGSDARVKVLPPPSRSLDADGFLRADLASDCVHGNAEYGAMVFDNVLSALKEA